jgi:hypothetical protein
VTRLITEIVSRPGGGVDDFSAVGDTTDRPQ